MGCDWDAREVAILIEQYPLVGGIGLVGLLRRSHTAIVAKAKRLGVRSENRTRIGGRPLWSDAGEQLLASLYGIAGARAVAERLGVSLARVYCKAHRMGLRSTTQAILVSERCRMPTLREGIFDSWTPESAYLLGYIWADGSIASSRACGQHNTLRFGCAGRDEAFLRTIADALGYSRPLYKCPSGAVQFNVKSFRLVSALMDTHGLRPRKSYLDLPFPKNVPDDLLHHFARGNLDGDGTICVFRDKGRTRGTVRLLGSHRFIAGLADRVARLANLSFPGSARDKGLITGWTWGASRDVLRLGEWLYRDASIWLPRKRQKFDYFAESQR